MPETRQSSLIQLEELRADMKEAMRSELNQFFKSTEFKDIFAEAAKSLIVETIEEATLPLLKRIEILETKLLDVTVKANENEQYSRKYNLRLVGLNEDEGEDCVDKVVDFCKEKLDLNIDKEIDRAHRLGPKSTDKNRSVIVKFKSYGVKATICSKRKKLKGTNFYINEDLTKFNVMLFNYARTQCSRVKSVWSSDGKILVRNVDDKILRIRQMEDFARFNLNGILYSSSATGIDNQT